MNLILALLLSLPLQSSSFSPAARQALACNGAPSIFTRPTAVVTSSRSSSLALAAKKRRRRKTAASPAPTTQSDELPDFDDGEDESADVEPVQTSVAASASSSAPAKSVAPIKRGAGLNAALAEEVGGNVDGLDQDVILGAMRGKAGGDSWVPPRSIQDTLADRRLEKFMDFDKMVERDGGGGTVELPEFDDVISRRKQREAMQEGRVEDAAMIIDTRGLGKKAARNAERKAAAMQREAEMEEEKNPFEDLNILKLLENGAWVGIGLLVVWEIYINSPLFDRAAPLIPVVYDEVTPPGM
eukprot:CAMPEP_0172529792 /NCGR_PEP_ID=MMETSP1067-20121228/3779_1 /TAXON_ID=265564 ORGANISM="Thalassiosira punctigera, Strain Tpunct2005C2" /NCGR_SAMPLE_ID=MMETSP1067 /ASSEMBLY_ACC=CAM_ASM_000444 /LENGTH=298 /DNA_ID=CAMNT_0013313915 /DNA_START=136 /DNA_END=1032 /DNA_ORIENTATION=+